MVMENVLYKNKYKVSASGEVYNLAGKKLKPGKDGSGYHFVFIYHNKKKKQEKVHRLVAKCFIPNHKNKPQVNHIDGNKDNNHVSNLEWVTQSENMKHAFRLGLCENTIRAAKANGKKVGCKTIINAIEATKKKVIDTKTGNVFSSVREAADKIGLKYDTLRHQLNGVNRNKTNLKYFKQLNK
jgi:hypothetical protein